MVSFSSPAFLAIAVWSLFAGVDAAVLTKRQSEEESGDPLDTIIKSIMTTLNIDLTGLLNIDFTYGLDEQERDLFGPIFLELIPAAFDGLTGPGNNVSITGVSGQSPFSIGLGFSPINGSDASGFNSTSVFSLFSSPICEIISSALGGGDFTAFPIPPFGADGSFPDSPTIPGGNSTFSKP